jgi:TolB protein
MPGGEIVFYSERDGNPEIYTVDADGSNLQRLTSNPASDMCPDWSPDGSQIAFISDRDGSRQIYVMNADGSDPHPLTDDVSYKAHPAWSPDGSQIAYVSDRDGNREIYVTALDGSNTWRLTDNPASDMRPDWSPYGQQISFMSDRGGGEWEIWVMAADGRYPRRLGPGVFAAWSPGGSKLVYYVERTSNHWQDIYLMDLEGNVLKQLTDMPRAVNEDPDWSPDGTRVVFQSNRDGNFEIYVMDSDGRNQQRITDHPGGDYWPAWRPGEETAPASEGTLVGATRTRDSDGMVMVYAPGGEFDMGSNAIPLEWPIHAVTLDSFWIDRTEVSNSQYRTCVEAGVCEEPTCFEGVGSLWDDDDFGGSDQPVVCVSWYAASTYCEWAGGRLPTEAEWEYAARGPQSLTYPWGDEFDGRLLNTCDASCGLSYGNEDYDDGYAYTAPVGSFPEGASWCGALDMAGNVWEWVLDWMGWFTAEPQVNPTGPTSANAPDHLNQRATRGGAWDVTIFDTRSSARKGARQAYELTYLGFRCVSSTAP